MKSLKNIQASKCMNCNVNNCLTEQRDRGADKDLRWADRQDGEELATTHRSQAKISQRGGVVVENETDQ